MTRSDGSETHPLTTTRREALKLAGAATVGGVAATLASGAPVGADVRAVVPTAQRFSVTIDGLVFSAILSLQLINSQSDVDFVLQPSGSATAVPSGLASQAIVLQRAWSSSKTDWIQWRALVLEGKTTVYSKNIAVEILAANLDVIERFTFSSAWPASYVGPTLAAAVGSQHLVESITCVYEDVVVS
jgi:phage tail-like protein